MRVPQELDLRGLKCPLPVLRTRKALRRMRPGERLLLLCTDPLAGIDIPHLLREEGDGLEHRAESDGVARFLIVRGERPATDGASAGTGD
jgi:tRNA 2-thiouridine synthesizing protein A